MTTTEWNLTVLLPHDENHRPVAAGTAQSRDDAGQALTAALVDAARRWGRREFAGTLGERKIVVLPGLTVHDVVDEDAVRAAVGELAG